MSTDSPLDRSDAVNLASRIVSRLDTGSYKTVTDKGVKCLADAVLIMDRELSRLYALPSEIGAQQNAAAQDRATTMTSRFSQKVADGIEPVPASAAPSGDKSETPRTDAAILRGESFDGGSITWIIDADFARQLERELNAARERAERLSKDLDDALSLVATDNRSDRGGGND